MKALVCWVGLVAIALGLACSSASPRCKVSNCDGCCDKNGMCQRGTEQFACGFGAALCTSCPMNMGCIDGACGLLDGGNGGGSGGGTGGGFAGDGGCSPQTCAGCCDPGGICRGGIANNACGKNGSSCVVCPMGKSCQMNACETFTCTGCVSTTGNCLVGTSSGACGINGANCMACLSSQSCVSGACQTSTTCSSATCAGCCSGTSCIDPPTSAQCGHGGDACAACSGAEVCNAGVCGPAMGTGGGAGGGSGGGCGPASCANGCCDPIFNTCVGGTDDLLCGNNGMTCLPCLFGLHCTSQMCQ